MAKTSKPKSTSQSLPWQEGKGQILKGRDYAEVSPSNKIDIDPQQVTFHIDNYRHLLFGPMTWFNVEGAFQVQAAGSTAWKNCDASEIEKVVLQPNWFEHLVHEVTVFCNNTHHLTTTNEGCFVAPFLNTYLYGMMNPESKKLLCPERCHPANCLPGKKDSWSVTADDWTSYAKHVFANKAFRFHYVPPFLFPFHQGANFGTDTSAMLPLPLIGSLQVTFRFRDTQDHIFRKAQDNDNSYRFAFSDMSLTLQQARLSEAEERLMRTSKKDFWYSGVTRMQLVETVPSGALTYKMRFESIFLPEALFIFCLDKMASAGRYSFAADDKQNVFLPHNIQSLDMSFNGMRFTSQSPHIGNYQSSAMDAKQLFDHLMVPPFNVKQDSAKLTLDSVTNGAENTAYPHVYIPLTTGPGRQRLVPPQDDGSCTTKRGDLDIELKFDRANSTPNSEYIVYAVYTDASLIYSTKDQKFHSPYLKYMN